MVDMGSVPGSVVVVPVWVVVAGSCNVDVVSGDIVVVGWDVAVVCGVAAVD